MCGFAGFARSERIGLEGDEATLRRMVARIAHRGPDGEGVFLERGLAMGHRRLSIIDLATGSQPMLEPEGRYGIVFNGEIYNYKELRDALRQRGHSFRTDSDTEVILRAFRERGPAALADLNGIFAFAIFDRQTGEVFLARDQFGVKPLYYGVDAGGNLFFGSELKALLPFLGPGRPSLCPDALEAFLLFESVPAPLSIFREIKKLPPGHYGTFSAKGLQLAEYYRPHLMPKWEGITFHEAAQRLEELLAQATRRQLVADVPVGSFLSGGVDSSLVAALAARASGGRLETFSIGFEQKSFDESQYAEIVSRAIGSRHHREVFSLAAMGRELPAVMENMDEPFADPSILPTAMLSRFTKGHVKVAMSGDGSDEIFAGYPTYAARKFGGWLPAWAGVAGGALASVLPTSLENISADFKIKRFFRGFETSDPDLRHQLWLGAFTPREMGRLLVEPRRFGPEGLLAEHMAREPGLKGWERSLWADFRFYLQDTMFTKVDRASMLHGLEVRVPFLDPDLVAFALRLPGDFKLRGSRGKAVLKDVALRHLPQEIVNRPKKGFGIPVAHWIRGELNELFRDRLSPARIAAGGLFQPREVSRMLAAHESGRIDYRKQLWAIFVFECWRENYGN